jgi:hypothetical protein
MNEISKHMASELDGIRHYGLTLIPANRLEAAFDWAIFHMSSVEWIEAIMVSEQATQPSMEHSRNARDFRTYDEFRASCNAAAKAWSEFAETARARAYFEVGLLEPA